MPAEVDYKTLKTSSRCLEVICCGLVQVTAFGAVKANGETGTLPLGVNFQVGSDATTATSGASAYTGGSSQVRLAKHIPENSDVLQQDSGPRCLYVILLR